MEQKRHSYDTYTEFGSENFEEFLAILGEKIRLRGWERFRGGLDVKGKHEIPSFQAEISFGDFIFIPLINGSCFV